jgi:hypothetical protein
MDIETLGPPTTFTVRPLTPAEIAAAGGSIGLLLPAVQKVRDAAPPSSSSGGGGGGAGKVSFQDLHFTTQM